MEAQQQQQQHQQQAHYGGQHDQYSQNYAAPSPTYASPALEKSGPSSEKRGGFLAIFVGVFLLVALVIGLGAGLGVSQRNLHDAQSSLAAAQSSLASFVSTPPVSATPTTPTATSATTSSSPSPTAKLSCPVTSNTTYTSQDSGKQFRQFCGIDYSGNGQAVDVGNVTASTFNDCMDACAANDKCSGCGWGVIDGDKGKHKCWMKSNLTKSHTASSDWAFAVLLQSSDTPF